MTGNAYGTQCKCMRTEIEYVFVLPRFDGIGCRPTESPAVVKTTLHVLLSADYRTGTNSTVFLAKILY